MEKVSSYISLPGILIFVDCYTKSTTLRTNQTHCTYCAKTICPHTSSAVYSMELLSATKSTWGERDFMSFETAARSRLRVRLSQLGATVPRCTDVCLAKTSPTKFHIKSRLLPCLAICIFPCRVFFLNISSYDRCQFVQYVIMFLSFVFLAFFCQFLI